MKNNLRTLGLALCMVPMYLHAETQQDLKPACQPAREQAAQSAEAIPAGTIILLRLNSTLRSDKSASGDAITATIMQDVSLAAGGTLPAGSKVTGYVVEAITSGRGSDEPRISFQFDQIRLGSQTIPITANLRAVASKAATLAATPRLTSSEYADNQVQIGGDQISYGSDAPVMVGSQVVGKYTNQGVLAFVGQHLGTQCGGTIDANAHLQALWLSSVNACRQYGFGDLRILHSGRTEPLGEVTLTSNGEALKVGKGSAMLLRIDGSRNEEAQSRTTSSRGTGQ
jgi:hypothetical protein